MKKTKRNYVIIALIIVLLSLAIGYAVLNDQLEISGTANVKGTFDLVFANAKALGKDYEDPALRPMGATVNDGDVVLSDNDNKLDVAVELAYPGAGQAFSVDIINNSSTDAICEKFTFSGSIIDDPDVEVYFPKASNGWTEGDIIAKNETKTLIFYVKWKADSQYMDANGKELKFSATFDYRQNVEGEFQGDTTNYKVQDAKN